MRIDFTLSSSSTFQSCARIPPWSAPRLLVIVFHAVDKIRAPTPSNRPRNFFADFADNFFSSMLLRHNIAPCLSGVVIVTDRYEGMPWATLCRFDYIREIKNHNSSEILRVLLLLTRSRQLRWRDLYFDHGRGECGWLSCGRAGVTRERCVVIRCLFLILQSLIM